MEKEGGKEEERRNERERGKKRKREMGPEESGQWHKRVEC